MHRTVREEARVIWSWGEHHRRLVARFAIALGVTALIDVAGSVAIWLLERDAAGTEIHHLGDAFFFTTVQLLTVSSQLRNPVTAGGRVLDVFLELWALGVVTGLAGSFASFFLAADRQRSGTSQTTPSGGSVTSAE
jgi:hypothetical protein